jgi:hypothetical protein
MAGFGPGDNVDNGAGHATDQLTYTLQWQGGGIAGGNHGVRFRPSSQSVSCWHQICDRRQTGRGRSGTSVQPVSRVSRRHVLRAAGAARHAPSAAGRTARQAFAVTWPLNLPSANDRATGARVHWRTISISMSMGIGASAPNSANGRARMQKPQPPVVAIHRLGQGHPGGSSRFVPCSPG